MKAHRHTLGHEHDHEPVPGLPERLPAGEHILWQGAPSWRSLAVRAFHLRKLAVYFGALLALRAAFDLQDGLGAAQIATGLAWLGALAAIGLGLVAVGAWLSATQTMYTVTNKRVVMRIGIVLTVTFNLPFRQIESAGLLRHPDGTGDLPLTLAAGQRIAYLQLWPHARPWMLKRPQPMLRCVPDVDRVAAVLRQAWSAATGLAASAAAATAPATAPAAPQADAGLPVRPALVPRRAGPGGLATPVSTR